MEHAFEAELFGDNSPWLLHHWVFFFSFFKLNKYYLPENCINNLTAARK